MTGNKRIGANGGAEDGKVFGSREGTGEGEGRKSSRKPENGGFGEIEVEADGRAMVEEEMQHGGRKGAGYDDVPVVGVPSIEGRAKALLKGEKQRM